ncbi:MAG: hypothetical protein ACP5GY_05700 [Vulcanisaeta sp.]
MVNIGVLKLRGSMPYYEELPFNVIVDKPNIIKDLDALIMPPGTLVESRVLERYGWLGKEVWDFVERGGYVIGVCSGAQLLSRSINLNVRGVPGYVNGIGILDISFEPLIVTGPVRVKVINESWATKGLLNKELIGWQAHTYGKMVIQDHNNVQVDGISIISRYNYRDAMIEAPTLVSSRKYRVFGTMVHGILGPESPIARNMFRELDVHDESIKDYYRKGQERTWLLRKDSNSKGNPRIITVVSTMTGEGKTLITSAIAHCLNESGYYVGVAKLGGDIRDLHPSLYILKRPFKPWMSIKLKWNSKSLGWTSWPDTIKEVTSLGIDFLIVEGVMGLLTGSSRDRGDDPSSTLGFIRHVNTDVVLIASASYDGVEGALFRLRHYVNKLIELDRKPIIVILNNAYHGVHEDEELRKFNAELNALSIYFVTISNLELSSKPEELIDLGDYEEASVIISRNICNSFTSILKAMNYLR